jgi:hypothetical protein
MNNSVLDMLLPVAPRQIIKRCNCMCSRRGWVYGWVTEYIIGQLEYQTLWSMLSK